MTTQAIYVRHQDRTNSFFHVGPFKDYESFMEEYHIDYAIEVQDIILVNSSAILLEEKEGVTILITDHTAVISYEEEYFENDND